MDNDCFNIAVRILACDEGVLFADPPIHYMDLQFCVNYQNSSFNIISMNMFLNSIFYSVHAVGFNTRVKSFCDKETIQKLATLFDSWHGIDNKKISCNMVSKVFFPLFVMVYCCL